MSLWAGHECTVSRTGDNYADQTRLSGHNDRAGDLERFAALGVSKLRYPLLWERHGGDFDWADRQLAGLRRLGIAPIAGLIHHGSGPAHTSLLDDGFASGLAAHARATAERFDWITDWTPVNEPLTTARFSGLYGLWYPHHRDERSCWLALLNQIDATRAAMREIRRIIPAARLIQTEDLGHVTATAPLAEQAVFENERRWLTWDLLAGRVTPAHPLWVRIAGHGFGDRLHAIADDPCPADIIGINHYLCSNRFLTHEFGRHPGIRPANDGTPCINLDAVRTVAEPLGIGALLAEAGARYGQALAITECHNASTRDEQMRWFYQVWQAAEAARDAGVDVVAVTAWSLLGAYDWNSLLTRSDRHYEVGVFDARADPPRATAMASLLPALARGVTLPQGDIVRSPGWWQRADRFLAGYAPPGSVNPRPVGRPILITGRTGTLGRMLGGMCERRSLPYVLTGRETLAMDDTPSMARALDDHRPWAVINCAGVVSIDRAEAEPDLCHVVNAVGPELLARACAERGIAFVQMSTDQVFDGRKGEPYVESNATSPLNAYGRSKAEAERRVLAVHPQALVARTAAFFSPDDRHNFAVHAVDTLSEGRTFTAAADQIVSPAYVPDLANALLDLLIDGDGGIRHLTSAGGMSWAEFARRLAREQGLDERLVVDAPTLDRRLAASRPADARLASERGQVMPTLDWAVARFAASYCSPAAAYATAAE